MESILHSLGIEWKLLIAQMINFGVLAFVLFKLIYKPLLEVLDKREKMVKDAEAKSSSIDDKMAEIKALEEKVISEARKASDKLIRDTEHSAKELKEKLSKEAEAHAEKIVKEAENKLRGEAEARDAQIRKEIKLVVAGAIEATVAKYLDNNAKQMLVDEASAEAQKIESFVSKH